MIGKDSSFYNNCESWPDVLLFSFSFHFLLICRLKKRKWKIKKKSRNGHDCKNYLSLIQQSDSYFFLAAHQEPKCKKERSLSYAGSWQRTNFYKRVPYARKCESRDRASWAATEKRKEKAARSILIRTLSRHMPKEVNDPRELNSCPAVTDHETKTAAGRY